MKATQQLHEMGQSLWLDNITRGLLMKGTLRPLHPGVLGHRAHLEPNHFRSCAQEQPRIRPRYPPEIAGKSKSGEALFFELAIEDLRQAADLLSPDPRSDQRRGWLVSWRYRPCWPTTLSHPRRSQGSPCSCRSAESLHQNTGERRRDCPPLRSQSSRACPSTSRSSFRPHNIKRLRRRICAASSAASPPV